MKLNDTAFLSALSLVPSLVPSLVLSAFATSVFAQPESIHLSYGPDLSSKIDVKDTRLALRWHLTEKGVLENSQWSDRFLLDTSVSYWDNRLDASPSHSAGGGDDIYGFFITPVWQFKSPSQRYYLDVGLGAGWISDTQIRYKGSLPLEKAHNFNLKPWWVPVFSWVLKGILTWAPNCSTTPTLISNGLTWI